MQHTQTLGQASRAQQPAPLPREMTESRGTLSPEETISSIVSMQSSISSSRSSSGRCEAVEGMYLILSMVTNEDKRAPVVALHPVLDQAPDAGVHLLANHSCAEVEPETTSEKRTLCAEQGVGSEEARPHGLIRQSRRISIQGGRKQSVYRKGLRANRPERQYPGTCILTSVAFLPLYLEAVRIGAGVNRGPGNHAHDNLGAVGGKKVKRKTSASKRTDVSTFQTRRRDFRSSRLHVSRDRARGKQWYRGFGPTSFDLTPYVQLPSSQRTGKAVATID